MGKIRAQIFLKGHKSVSTHTHICVGARVYRHTELRGLSHGDWMMQMGE